MSIVGEASKERFIAAFIDNLIGFALMMTIALLIPEVFPVIKFIFYILIYFAYFIVFEALWSRTLGKYFQGLIVRKLDGGNSDWKTALIRGAVRLIEVNPFLLGGLPAGLLIISTERKQRLGDILAGTVVVSDKTRWFVDSPSSSDVPDQIQPLSELLEKLDYFDPDSTIYAERNPDWSADSRAIIGSHSEGGKVTDPPKDLIYFLKVYMAEEALEMWKERCGGKPSTEEKCRAVIYYAENDNYIECPSVH